MTFILNLWNTTLEFWRILRHIICRFIFVIITIITLLIQAQEHERRKVSHTKFKFIMKQWVKTILQYNGTIMGSGKMECPGKETGEGENTSVRSSFLLKHLLVWIFSGWWAQLTMNSHERWSQWSHTQSKHRTHSTTWIQKPREDKLDGQVDSSNCLTRVHLQAAASHAPFSFHWRRTLSQCLHS